MRVSVQTISLLLLLQQTIFSQNVQDGITDNMWYRQRNDCVNNCLAIRGKIYGNHLYSGESELEEIKESDDLEPYCYLFDQDSLWTQRVWRTIKIDSKEDSTIWLGPSKRAASQNNVGGVLGFMKENLVGRQGITMYEAADFRMTRTQSEIEKQILPLWDKIVELKLKEEWSYDKVTGRLNCQVIGLGLIAKIRGEKRGIGWCYWPGHEREWNGFSGVLDSSYTQSSEGPGRQFFNSHLYSSYIDYWESPAMRNSWKSMSEPKPHRNDLEALVLLQYLNEIVNFPDSSFSYGNEHVFWSGKLKAQGFISNGMKTGEWKMYYPNGSVRLKVEYIDNLPNGTYTSYWINGTKQEEGRFEYGIREKTWSYWYESGILMSKKQLSKGWYDGLQEVWYENGNKYFVYSYSDWKMNGDFSWWYSDGSLMEHGRFVDGIKVGDWTYDLKIPEVLLRILKNSGLDKDPASSDFWNFPPSAIDDGRLTFNAVHNPSLGLEFNGYFGKCLESVPEIK